MNKLMMTAIMGIAIALTACGGDSDSSGSYTSTSKPDPKPSTPSTNPQPTIAQCKSEGNNIFVPNNQSCSISLPRVNNGANLTYTCSNGVLTASGITARSGAITLNGVTIKCTA